VRGGWSGLSWQRAREEQKIQGEGAAPVWFCKRGGCCLCRLLLVEGGEKSTKKG
jgi:hypothetical protein